ncbi:MAG: NTP transferase domain-containing protein, partial [Anaerolineales bacterium]|nr:NTP transferase domain-containing protein [Anaerolineales bacterium]
AGEPMLMRVYTRARRAKRLDEVVIATSVDVEDEPIVRLCEERGVPYSRGSAKDVLDRFMNAAREHNAEVIVRLTADCPVIDPELIDQTVDALLMSDPLADFATNRLPWDRTFPIGLDIEVCSTSALEIAWLEADELHQREHVMPFLYEKHDRFRILHVRNDKDYGQMRWTVDTAEDLTFIREVYARFDGRDDFTWGLGLQHVFNSNGISK